MEARLSGVLPLAKRVEGLLDAHAEAQRNRFLEGIHLTAVECGRVREAVVEKRLAS